jgi:hypothetical protein
MATLRDFEIQNLEEMKMPAGKKKFEMWMEKRVIADEYEKVEDGD